VRERPGRLHAEPLGASWGQRSGKHRCPGWSRRTVLAVKSKADLPETSSAERKSFQKWALRIVVAIPLAAIIIYLLIWFGPDLLARHDIGPVTGPLRILRLQQARDAARGRLLTLGAGLFAAGALIFTALNFNLLRRNSERADQWQRRTYELTEQGQVTDRYTRAIEQLGSTTVDVTIGGIYALERIARDSPTDHPTVMEVLAACVRENSDKPLQEPTPPDVGTPEPAIRPDIQAAVTVLGRRDTTHDRGRISLRRAHLPYADLPKADFASADLTGASLWSANLTGAILRGAILRGAILRGADLTGAELTGADLTDAKLKAAKWPVDAPVPEGWERDTGSGRLNATDTDPGPAEAK
jgi:pentapeptide repeat protein